MSKKKKSADRQPPRNGPSRAFNREPAENTAALAPESPQLARTYLPESFLVTLLCLTPVAIPAIYYGFQVREASLANDQPKADAASELARIWFILSVCFGATANIAILCAYLISQQN
jgi:hypothetical protein